MRAQSPVCVCCVALLAVLLLRLSSALPVRTAAETHSLIFPTNLHESQAGPKVAVGTSTDRPVAVSDIHRNLQTFWRVLLHKEPPLRLSKTLPDQNRSRPRSRRHANRAFGSSRGQFMRVGCVLGTCQVQNLSHRLYQLIGQSGRQDSAPINPRSPHSYG